MGMLHALLTCMLAAALRFGGYVAVASANLTDADLYAQDMRDSTLRYANLTGVRFAHANLTDSDLTGANLTDADLLSTVLAGANLTDADLTGASMSANLSGVEWSNTTCPDGSNSDDVGGTCENNLWL